MTEAKRQTLKQKVASGQARQQRRTRGDNTTTIVDRAGEKALEAKDKLVEFAKEHPIATVAGGLALGILVSGLFKRSPTRQVASRAAGRASALAAIGAEIALAYAQQAMTAANEAAHTGAEKAGELGGTARELGRDAADRAGELGEGAKLAARDAGKRLAHAWRNRAN